MLLRLTRLLTAFALALTIPLQGLAAATAGVCMAMGHHQTDMSAAAHDHGADHRQDEDGSDHSSDGAHCAPCVACCAAAHIAPAAHVYLPEISPAAAIAASPSLPAGFLPEKLDRPPLSL